MSASILGLSWQRIIWSWYASTFSGIAVQVCCMRTALTWRPFRNGWGIVQLLQLPILTPILISAKKYNLLKQLWGIIPHRWSKSGRDDLEGCSFIKNKKRLIKPRNKPFYKCRRPESNRYGYHYPRDFKSRASASSATAAFLMMFSHHKWDL